MIRHSIKNSTSFLSLFLIDSMVIAPLFIRFFLHFHAKLWYKINEIISRVKVIYFLLSRRAYPWRNEKCRCAPHIIWRINLFKNTRHRDIQQCMFKRFYFLLWSRFYFFLCAALIQNDVRHQRKNTKKLKKTLLYATLGAKFVFNESFLWYLCHAYGFMNESFFPFFIALLTFFHFYRFHPRTRITRMANNVN